MIKTTISWLRKPSLYNKVFVAMLFFATALHAEPQDEALYRYQQMLSHTSRYKMVERAAEVQQKIECYKNPLVTDVISGNTIVNSSLATAPLLSANPCAHNVVIQGNRVVNRGIINNNFANDSSSSMIKIKCAAPGKKKTVIIQGLNEANYGIIDGRNSALIDVEDCENTGVSVTNSRIVNNGKIIDRK